MTNGGWPPGASQQHQANKKSNVGNNSDKISANNQVNMKNSGGSWQMVNYAMCLLCTISLAMSGLLVYREFELEKRISILENAFQYQYQQQQQPAQQLQMKDTNVDWENMMIQRIRKELEQEFLAKADNSFRNKRDLSSCSCPPGKF